MSDNKLTTAINKVFDDLEKLSDEEFDQGLRKHENSMIAKMLRYASQQKDSADRCKRLEGALWCKHQVLMCPDICKHQNDR